MVIVNKQKNGDMDNYFIYNQYGERLAILTPKISKFVDEQQS